MNPASAMASPVFAQERHGADATDRIWIGGAVVLFAIGLVSRVAPLFDQGGRLLRQWPSEDGYLMLTIARNLSMGNGFAVAGGEIPTNGTQPLATLLWSICFRLAGHDRETGVFLVLLVELLIAIASACLLWRLGARVLAGQRRAAQIAALAAGGWFASPIVTTHSMNCLESGLYALAVLATCWLLVVPPTDEQAARSLSRWGWIGAALAIVFWARNDGVFLCAAVGVAHLTGCLPGPPLDMRRRIEQLAVAAFVTLLLALPWLLHNYLGFGHVMPISGQAESMHAEWGGNLDRLPSSLFEYYALLLLVPNTIQTDPIVLVLASIACLAAVVATARGALRSNPSVRALFLVIGTFGSLLAAFYGLAFGAPHFMTRYLFPLSPFIALAWAAGVVMITSRLRLLSTSVMQLVTIACAVVLVLALQGRMYVQGTRHGNFAAAEWVMQNVSNETWVGAVQTGTLGFFHDRTINLDGKVNPSALEARRRNRIPEYVVEGPIQYLVDWPGIAAWLEKPPLASQFELFLTDERRNLVVLRRRGAGGSG